MPANEPTSMSRRAFLSKLAGGDAPPIRPPWTRESAVRSLCTSCGDCVSACPEKIISLDAQGFPALSFDSRGCVLCGRCEEACPEPGLFDRTLAPPVAAVAQVGDSCLNARGVLCQSCRDACDQDAIRVPMLPNAAAQVLAEACTGCGMCLPACPVGAVQAEHLQ